MQEDAKEHKRIRWNGCGTGASGGGGGRVIHSDREGEAPQRDGGRLKGLEAASLARNRSRLSWWRWRSPAAPPWWHPWARSPLGLRRPLRPPRARTGGPRSLPFPVTRLC